MFSPKAKRENDYVKILPTCITSMSPSRNTALDAGKYGFAFGSGKPCIRGSRCDLTAKGGIPKVQTQPGRTLIEPIGQTRACSVPSFTRMLHLARHAAQAVTSRAGSSILVSSAGVYAVQKSALCFVRRRGVPLRKIRHQCRVHENAADAEADGGVWW